MPSLTAISGTASLLYMFDPASGAAGQWLLIGGQVTNDHALETALIDMSNKDSGGVQEFFEGEARQNIADSMTVFFSSDTAYTAVLTAARTKALRRFMFVRGPFETAPGADVFSAMISTVADNAGNEAILTSTVTLASANDDDLLFGVLFEDAIDVNTDDADDADGNFAVARA